MFFSVLFCVFMPLGFWVTQKKCWVTLFRSHNFFGHMKKMWVKFFTTIIFLALFMIFCVFTPFAFWVTQKNFGHIFWVKQFFLLHKKCGHFFVTVISHFLCHTSILGHIFLVTWSHFINYSYSIPHPDVTQTSVLAQKV